MNRIYHLRHILIGFLLVAVLPGVLPIAAPSGYPTRVDPYVNDFASLLTAEHTTSLRSLLSGLKSDNGVELVAVTVDSIRDYATGDASLESFATNLFNTWGLGDAQKNNGVLILVAWKDRAVRIEVGAGYGRLLDADMQAIIDEQMIPAFRREDYSQGIYDGARAVTRRLYALSGKTPAAGSPAAGGTATQAQSDGVNILPFMIMVVTGAAASVFGADKYARYHRRRCPNCQTYMQRLDEVADDVYLDSGQKVEEMLRSVNYDVWKCPTCNFHMLQGYQRWSSGFGQCPQCSYRTLKTDTKTIEEPTYVSSGTKIISQDCRQCKYHDEDKVILPMLTPPAEEEETTNTSSRNHFSNSRSSSWSHSSSSRTSSSSHSSSSHTSSGGHSSGGGASGKW